MVREEDEVPQRKTMLPRRPCDASCKATKAHVVVFYANTGPLFHRRGCRFSVCFSITLRGLKMKKRIQAVYKADGHDIRAD